MKRQKGKIPMPIDYSHFQRADVSVAKIAQHAHPDGAIHIEIDVLLPANVASAAEYIRKEFDRVMQSVPGAQLVKTEEYKGIEASLHDEPISDYYERVTHQRDTSHEN